MNSIKFSVIRWARLLYLICSLSLRFGLPYMSLIDFGYNSFTNILKYGFIVTLVSSGLVYLCKKLRVLQTIFRDFYVLLTANLKLELYKK
eukprot:snap_masked-scaffold_8-processed-gene-11.11-mRNA-1 protein AED:1.00 eAED:1.00 QI:0/0/0/0/1/1/2/0/89